MLQPIYEVWFLVKQAMITIKRKIIEKNKNKQKQQKTTK